MKPTVHFGDTTLDGETFFGRATRAASALAAAGVGPGDLFAVMLRNEPTLLELQMAAHLSGARWVPVNHHFKADEVHTILAATGARVLIVHADLLEGVRGGVPQGVRIFSVEPDPYTRQACGIGDYPSPHAESWERWRDDTARPPAPPSAPGGGIFFTSGTTGRPKGVVFEPATPSQVAAMIAKSQAAYGLHPGARALLTAPMYHSGVAYYALMAVLMNVELVLEPRFDAETMLRLIDAQRISHVYVVPAMAVRLLRLPPTVSARYDLSSVRFVASTGSCWPPEVRRQMIEWWGPVFHDAYGASEMGLMTLIDSADALRKPGSAGRALPSVAIRVLADDGHDCAPGEIGTICVRNDEMPRFTYRDDPQARAAAEREGMVTLGDLGYLDDEGFLYIVDRRNDVVNSAGTKVYTPEVESTLIALPGVADCAVYGIPDPEYGEALVAAVQPLPGAALTAAQVQDFVRQRLAGFKVPRRVEFHPQLPREDSGKLFKRRLRAATIAAAAAG